MPKEEKKDGVWKNIQNSDWNFTNLAKDINLQTKGEEIPKKDKPTEIKPKIHQNQSYEN